MRVMADFCDSARHAGGNFESAANEHFDEADASYILTASKSDVIALWRDPDIRDIISTRKLRLEDRSRYFLDNIDRIATLNYTPSEGMFLL